MSSFLARLKAATTGRPLIWDGAVGTELMKRGLSGKVPELWNLERPDALTAIHLDYLNAGAEVVQTNTFGATTIKLGLAGIPEHFEAVNRGAVAAAREAVKRAGRGFVAGDLGPCGQMLAPSGPVSMDEAIAVYTAQVRVLADAGVDLISIETMFDLNEAEAAVRGARAAAPGLPIVASMTFKKTKRGFFTMMGNSPADCAGRLLDAGAVMVGANCGMGMVEMTAVIAEYRKATDQPLIAQANAGNPEVVGRQTVYKESADGFATLGPGLRAAGATAIGACCGSSPEFIKRLAAAL
jgi:5-methyltetrahydrofolate--homocysteine methyltransferase